MRDIVQQLATDFLHLPDLVDEYVVHTPREEALKSSRQVCGVSHYLSKMATGEADMRKCALFGVTITCIDEVTDELGEDLYREPVIDAFGGDAPYEPLEILPVAADAAANDQFEESIRAICRAQDKSMAQLDDIGAATAEDITRDKGGWSATANLHMFKEDVSDGEYDLIWQFGGLMQMLDDYLDRPKDVENGLSTPFTYEYWDYDRLGAYLDVVEEAAAREWGRTAAHSRFFDICRLHRQLGRIENETRASASWFAPGYL